MKDYLFYLSLEAQKKIIMLL